LCYCLSCVYIVCCLIVVSLYFVCCLIVVPLPPGENPFAVNNNNNILRPHSACLLYSSLPLYSGQLLLACLLYSTCRYTPAAYCVLACCTPPAYRYTPATYCLLACCTPAYRYTPSTYCLLAVLQPTAILRPLTACLLYSSLPLYSGRLLLSLGTLLTADAARTRTYRKHIT
jgi:hypothetical protein